jgi:hypothetical protein
MQQPPILAGRVDLEAVRARQIGTADGRRQFAVAGRGVGNGRGAGECGDGSQ